MITKSTTNNHTWEFTLLFSLFYFTLGIGTTLWYPLFVMCVIGAWLFYQEYRELNALQPATIQLLLIGACIFIPALISLPFSIAPERTIKFLATYPLFFFAGYYLYKRLSQGVQIRPSLMFAVAVIAIWGGFSLWQFFDPDSPFSGRRGHYQGIHSRSNDWVDGGLMLGTILASSLALLWAIFYVAGQKYRSYVVTLAIIGLILLAGVRSAWVSVMFVLAIVGLLALNTNELSLTEKTRAGLVGISTVGVLAWVLFTNSNYLQSRWHQTTQIFGSLSEETLDRALSGRLTIWQDAIAIGLDRPLTGSGANTFRFAPFAVLDAPKSGNFVQNNGLNGESRPTGALHSHQALLDIFSGTGFPGLIGIALAYLLVLRLSINIWKTSSLLATAAIAGWWAGFLPFNTHYSFYGGWSTAWFWVWLGISAGLYRQSLNRSGVKTDETS